MVGKRSKWKGPYVKTDFLTDNSKNYYKKISRNTKIIPFFIGKTFEIHNGKSFAEITVTENMINHRFGEFVPTRKINISKKKHGTKK